LIQETRTINKTHLIAGAVSALTLASAPGYAAKAPTIQQQLEAMQKAFVT
jgi:hypothetical protein